MKLVVGLGNPGKEYEKTRHNAGFIVLDHFIKNETWKEKYNGLFIKKKYDDEEVIFLKPIKYMNNSGEVVRKFVDFYKIDTSDIFVIYDDINYPVGEYKLKPKGSSGGHNGINNIITNLKTEDVKRLKIGISYNNTDLVKYVTGKFNNEDYNKILDLLDETDRIIEDYIFKDFEYVMNKYNR